MKNTVRLIPTENPSAPKMECKLTGGIIATPDAASIQKYPRSVEGDWTLGNANASLTIIDYADYMCPYCGKLAPVLVQLYKQHPDDIRLIRRHFPLPNHNLSFTAAVASEAAGKQGKFWEFDEAIYAKQADWVSLTADQFNTYLNDLAKSLGLDVDKFKQDLKADDTNNKIKTALSNATTSGLDHTPFVIVNGLPYNGPDDINSLESLLALTKLEKNLYTYCPPQITDAKKQYFATLKTAKGDIVIQLFPDKAPLAVNSFVFLAQNHWFDNTTFYRVMADFIAQAGDPSGSGYGGPGYTFKNETNSLTYDKEGWVGMANAGADSNGSQFFITLAAATNLNGQYTIFGQVTQGMDVVKKLTLRDPQQDPSAAPGDALISVTIQEK